MEKIRTINFVFILDLLCMTLKHLVSCLDVLS